MPKLGTLTALVAAAAMALSACSQTSPETPTDGEPVELVMWTGFTGGDRPAYEAIVNDFNASHPNIKVTMEIQPWDTIAQKLPAAWATGQAPDLATPNFDPNVLSKYLETNSLLALDAIGEG